LSLNLYLTGMTSVLSQEGEGLRYSLGWSKYHPDARLEFFKLNVTDFKSNNRRDPTWQHSTAHPMRCK
jgi:hypothetical protein